MKRNIGLNDWHQVQVRSLYKHGSVYWKAFIDKLANSLPVDGGWSDNDDWSECSVSCGGGLQSRVRSCNNPKPANGGADCKGDAKEERPCNTNPCTGKESNVLR